MRQAAEHSGRISNITYVSLHHADLSHPPSIRFLVIGSGEDLEKTRKVKLRQAPIRLQPLYSPPLRRPRQYPSFHRRVGAAGHRRRAPGDLAATWRQENLSKRPTTSPGLLKAAGLGRGNTHLFSKAMVTESLWMSFTKPWRKRDEKQGSNGSALVVKQLVRRRERKIEERFHCGRRRRVEEQLN